MDFQLLERTLVGRSSSFSQNQNQRTILLKSCCKHHFNCCIDNVLSLLWCKYKKEAWQKVGVKCKLKTVVLPCGNWGSCKTFMMELFAEMELFVENHLLEMNNNKKDDLLFWYHKTTSPVPVQGDDSFLLWANTICLVQWFDDYELIRYTINPSDIYLFII